MRRVTGLVYEEFDEAALSVPGIVAAQLGALIDLTRAGLNIVANQPAAFEGHSQGVLGVEIARAWIAGDEALAASVFALARLIGAAAARVTRRARAPHAGDATYMVSVRGVSDLCGPEAGQDFHIAAEEAAARSAAVVLALLG